jgi:hypothetical protein
VVRGAFEQRYAMIMEAGEQRLDGLEEKHKPKGAWLVEIFN